MLRVGVAMVFLTLLFVPAKRPLRIPLHTAWKIWLAGLFAQAIPFCLLFWGERLISPGLGGIFNGTVPLWTFILGTVFLKKTDTFPPQKIIGLGLGLLGMAIIFWPSVQFQSSVAQLQGTFAVFLMAIAYAVGTLMSRHLLASEKPVDFHTNIFHQNAASLVFLCLVSFSFETWPSWPLSPVVWGASLYLGIFSTGIAFLLYFRLIREWGAVRASSVTYVVPILGFVWDYVFFHHLPTGFELVGALTILSGVVLIQKR